MLSDIKMNYKKEDVSTKKSVFLCVYIQNILNLGRTNSSRGNNGIFPALFS